MSVFRLDPLDNPLARELGERQHRMHGYGPNETFHFSGSECFDCGATVRYGARAQHDAFHATFTNRKDGSVSKVTWCDPGNHAFKTASPGSVHADMEAQGPNGEKIIESFDACAEHNPMRMKPDFIAKELNADYPIRDIRPDTVD